jgi:IS5 family transposase
LPHVRCRQIYAALESHRQRVGDRINAVHAAAGYDFGLLLCWLAEFLRAIIRAFAETVPAQKIA